MNAMGLSGVDWGIVIGVLGLMLTIYFGFKGRLKARSQKQTASGSSVAIQSGRDTKIGGE